MAFYIQYNSETGDITGTVMTEGDAPQPPAPVSQLAFDDWQQTLNKKIDINTFTLVDDVTP